MPRSARNWKAWPKSMGSAGKRMPIRTVSRVTPREVAPPLLPVKARHGGEYGSLGICLARSAQGVTAPSGSPAATPSAPADPARPGRVTRRVPAGPLGRVVVDPASAVPDAAVPAPAAAPSGGVALLASATAAPAPTESVPTVNCRRRAGTVRALTARKALAKATTGR